MILEDRLGGIEERVRTLETYFKIAIAVALIFGVTGGVVFSQLRAAQNEIAQLEQKVSSLDPIVKQAIASIQAEENRVKAGLAAVAEEQVRNVADARFAAHAKWIKFVYAQAAASDVRDWANGWWQKGLQNQAQQVEKEVR
jgi:hypothetical protein